MAALERDRRVANTRRLVSSPLPTIEAFDASSYKFVGQVLNARPGGRNVRDRGCRNSARAGLARHLPPSA